MIRKEIISPERLRRIPSGFGWVDHRLVREGHVRRHGREALSLYLFLVTVADADGVSWYSDESLCSHLNLEIGELRSARSELKEGALIAHRRPFHQVLEVPRPEEDERRVEALLSRALSEPAPRVRRPTVRREEEAPVRLGEVIERMAKGVER